MGKKTFLSRLFAAAPFLALMACDGPGNRPPPPPPPVEVAQNPPRSSAIALSEDEKTLVVANTDDGTVSIFDVETRNRVLLRVGAPDSEPWAVSITPDGSRAFVLLRKEGAVVEIRDLGSESPSAGLPVLVGAEPTALVLSPTGSTLYATSFVEGTVYVLGTAPLQVQEVVALGGNPRGLCMTNDLDEDDADELLFVTQFYGVPSGLRNAAFAPNDFGEGTDFGRKGVVHVLRAADLSLVQDVELFPLDDTGFAEPQDPNIATGAFPNQLHTCVVNNGRVYVPNMAASPRGAVKFNANVQALVSVFDLETLTEVRDQVGERSGTVNLNNLVKDQSAEGEGRVFVTQPLDLAFIPGTDEGYVVAAGNDMLLRVVWENSGAIQIGSQINFNIPVGQNPQGIAVGRDGTRLFVVNRITRDVSIVDVNAQAEIERLVSTAVPDEVSDPEGFARLRGQRFFNTASGRWSSEGWGACSACHPDGLTDGVTWHFAAGPRQTIPLDGVFNKNNPNDQRVLNWTGIFDEVHDFELNTRGVSGGLGAIVDQDNIPLDLATAIPGENHQGLNGSVKFLNGELGALPDWDQIEAFHKVIRSLDAPRSSRITVDSRSPLVPAPARSLDPAAVARGRQIFIDNKCQNCHGGPKWTISRLRYKPSFTNSEGFKTSLLNASGLLVPEQNPNTFQLETEDPNTCIERGGQQICGSPLGILRVTCVLRDVGTFGVPDPVSGLLDLSIEVAADMITQAQGVFGFNPPSLLSVGGSAPYLHHGQAATLEDLFTDRFASHHQANSPNFLNNLNNPAQQQQKADLIQFLLSINENTPPIQPDTGQELCPSNP